MQLITHFKNRMKNNMKKKLKTTQLLKNYPQQTFKTYG